MQQKSELPEGWAWADLENVCKFVSGKTPSDIKNLQSSGNIPFYKVSDMNNSDNKKYMISANLYLDENFVKKNRLKLESEGTVVFPKRGGAIYTNKKRILSKPSFYDLNIMGVRPILFSNMYLYYWFISIDLSQISDGSNVPQINNKNLELLQIPLPPLSEQHRIVSAIEALFARLDVTNEKLDRVTEILKKFRESVLAAACDGRLTNGWREENTNKDDTSRFFESITKKRMEYWEEENLKKLVSNGKMLQNNKWKQKYKEPEYSQNFDSLYLPDEWISVTIDQIASKVTDGDHNPPKRVENGIPHLTARNIKNWEITLDNCTYISPDDFEIVKTRYNPQKDDLIITCVGTIGETAIVPDNLVFSADRNLAVIRLTERGMDPKFLQYTLNAPLWKDIIKKGSSSTAQPHFYLKDIRALTVPLPPLPEQQEIVRRVDALFTFADSIEAKVAAAREKTEKLRQSILEKAFSGELVETEAEIARREGRDYETAEVLLERIKEERRKSGKKL